MQGRSGVPLYLNKKRSIIIALLFALIICTPVLAETKYVDSSNGLRLRERPNTDSNVVCVIPYGKEVSIKYKLNDWARAEYEDKVGYVKEEYLTDEDPLNGMQYLGNWHITAYTYTGNCCANGNYPTAGYTIACNSLDFGTRVYITGIGERVVEDRGPGWLGSAWCDVFMGSYNECVQWGSQYRDVYLIED